MFYNDLKYLMKEKPQKYTEVIIKAIYVNI